MGNYRKHIVRQPACLGVTLGRKFALRACVVEVHSLYSEFRKATADVDRDVLNTEEYSNMLMEFIKNKGLHAVEEKPILKIDGDRYHVDIEYKVVW